jgi:hypothetical protein
MPNPFIEEKERPPMLIEKLKKPLSGALHEQEPDGSV